MAGAHDRSAPEGDAEGLPRWERDAAEVAEGIARRKAELKFVLKTRDDPYFLEDWIRHHAAIAGLENLLVFDNMSVLPAVLDVYARYRRDGLTVVRFAAWCDDLHNTAAFGELYRALAQSATYFCALDTDEFVTLLHNGRHEAGAAILGFLRDNPACDAFPGIRLSNTDARRDRFTCGSRSVELIRPVRGGKPVLRSRAPFGPYINHNSQVDPRLYGPATRTNLAVLHMLNLSRAHRIMACRLMLIARGFADPDEAPEQIAARDPGGSDDRAVLRYLRQLRILLGDDPTPRDPLVALRPGCLELRPDGTIAWHGPAERAALCEVVQRPDLAVAWLR
jgi:hypothetical protein